MKIKKTLVAGVASLGLVVGMSGFAGAASGTNSVTGPDSTNIVKHIKKQRTRVMNNNNLTATNMSSQTAMSGHANATHNTTAGDAWSGDADNSNSMSATVHVNNSASGVAIAPMSSSSSSGTNSNTGPDSYNVVKTVEKSSVEVTNNNNLNVVNTSTQHAASGNATVHDNTTGGSAVTGNVSNNNSTSLNFSVTN